MCINMFFINRISLCFQLVFPFRATVMWIWTYDPRNRNVAKSDREKISVLVFQPPKVFHKMHIMNINLTTFTLSVIFFWVTNILKYERQIFHRVKKALWMMNTYVYACLSIAIQFGFLCAEGQRTLERWILGRK